VCAVIERHGNADVERGWRQTEGNFRNTKDGAHIRQGLLNLVNAFHRFNSAADVVFIDGGAGKHQRVENDVFRSEAVLFREQPVGTLRNGQLALARERLRLDRIFINATDHNGSAKLVDNRHDAFEFLLAILEVDGIDDGFAL